MLSDIVKWNPKKRIIKVIIPYVIWSVIYVLIHNYKEPSQILKNFIIGLITANSAAIMYFILVYCQFTLLIPFIDRLAKSKYMWAGFIISPLEIVIMRIIPLISGIEMNPYIWAIRHVSCLGWFTYFYMGYVLGRGIPTNSGKITTPKLTMMYIISLLLQIIEGYCYLALGEKNCGTQLKLSALLTGMIFVNLAFRYIIDEKKDSIKIFNILGNCSFGIYFSHLAVMSVLKKVPYYKNTIFPVNAFIVLLSCSIFVFVGRRVLGKYAKFFAL